MGQPRAEVQTVLAHWLDEHGITRARFAEELSLTVGTVNRLCRAVRRPGLELALEIEKYTKGAVPVSTWKDVKRTDKGRDR